MTQGRGGCLVLKFLGVAIGFVGFTMWYAFKFYSDKNVGAMYDLLAAIFALLGFLAVLWGVLAQHKEKQHTEDENKKAYEMKIFFERLQAHREWLRDVTIAGEMKSVRELIALIVDGCKADIARKTDRNKTIDETPNFDAKKDDIKTLEELCIDAINRAQAYKGYISSVASICSWIEASIYLDKAVFSGFIKAQMLPGEIELLEAVVRHADNAWVKDLETVFK